jgi:glycosyltransferase involved in cell wall biosynthesis
MSGTESVIRFMWSNIPYYDLIARERNSMHIVQVINRVVPAVKYGGTERVVWWLSKKLAELGHRVTLLAPPGSSCGFATVLRRDPLQSLDAQVPDDADIIHLHDDTQPAEKTPTIRTFHGNIRKSGSMNENTVFISADQARRHGGNVFIHHGLDLQEYGPVNWNISREHLVFLAKAAWKVKNVRDAIYIARKARLPLAVAGGHRLNFSMGFRLTLDPNARFLGMVDHQRKQHILNRGLALLFPVKWHEPFGLALIESLYFGNPVFGTPFGSLPEIVTADVGFLSKSRNALIRQVKELEQFDRRRCHEYVCDRFSSTIMAKNYLGLFEKVCNGENLHDQRPAWSGTTGPKYLPLDN